MASDVEIFKKIKDYLYYINTVNFMSEEDQIYHEAIVKEIDEALYDATVMAKLENKTPAADRTVDEHIKWIGEFVQIYVNEVKNQIVKETTQKIVDPDNTVKFH